MMTIKNFTHQEELINEARKGNSVVGNWVRGAGKTLVLAKILLEVKPRKVIYSSISKYGLREISEKVDELLNLDTNLKNTISKYFLSFSKLEIEFHTGEVVTVIPSNHSEGVRNVDYVFFNNFFDEKLSSIGKEYVLVTTQNNYNMRLQSEHCCKVIDFDIYDLIESGLYGKDFARSIAANDSYFNEWAILNKIPRDSDCRETIIDFKKEASEKLMKQFLSTPDTKDTVLTRKNIIEMLKDLKQI